jgi:vesicle-associated membrane protein 4
VALLLSDEDDEILNLASDTKESRFEVKDSKIDRVQAQIQDVVGSMKSNFTKIIDRGETLNDLNDRSEELSNSANVFQSRARSARRSMYFRTCRVRKLT